MNYIDQNEMTVIYDNQNRIVYIVTDLIKIHNFIKENYNNLYLLGEKLNIKEDCIKDSYFPKIDSIMNDKKHIFMFYLNTMFGGV